MRNGGELRHAGIVALVAAGTVLAISGCATASKTYGPDGQVAYSIGCSGSALSWGLCYEKAGEICGEKGYNVLARSGEGGLVAGGSGAGFFAGSTASRSMVVSCKL